MGPKRPRRKPPAPPQPTLFDSPTEAPPARPEPVEATGEAKKEKALKLAEDGHPERLQRLREALKKLYHERATDPYNPHPSLHFVTADDAVHILEKNNNYGYGDINDPKPWLGALFREPGWKFTGDWAPSVRASNNGRMNRCWRWEGA